MYTLYLHPTCSSSASVFYRLKDERLLSRVKIVALDPGHSVLVDALIPSVPALEVGGELVAVDPLEPEFVAAVLRDDRESLRAYVPRNSGEAVERFARSFIYSSYLMTLEYLSGNALEAALRSSFARASIRARFMGAEDSRRLVTSLSKGIEEVRSRVSEYLERVVAYTFLREALMVFGEDGYVKALNPGTALLWLQSKASIGRAHLDPGIADRRDHYLRKAERLVEVVKQREGKWVSRLLREFKELRQFAEELKDYLG